MALLRNKHHQSDPVWHVESAMVVAILLQLILPDRFTVGSRYLIPAVETLLLFSLTVTTPKEKIFRSLKRRVNVILLIAITSIGNIYGLGVVTSKLLQSGHVSNGRELILTALNIYLTNVIIFALWYWEIDGGGPGQRRGIQRHERDFLFPQNQIKADEDWHPTFIDYLYVSSTNATAFSPTDTMPLTRRAKMLMLAQSLVSLIAVALVAARAVNILN